MHTILLTSEICTVLSWQLLKCLEIVLRDVLNDRRGCDDGKGEITSSKNGQNPVVMPIG